MKKLLIGLLLIPVLALGNIKNPDSLIHATLVSKGYSARHASFWVKVSKLETANYTSVLYRYHNNLWGMSFFRVGNRPTKANYRVYHNNKPTRFAGFKTHEEAVEEIILYMKAANYPKDFRDLKSFVLFMKSKGYFEEPIGYYMKALSNV